MSKTLILIPSRLTATRLPGKPLLKINNLSIISHVVKKALKSRIGEVCVCTGDKEIFEDVKNNGGNCVLTTQDHKTGTDRIYEGFKKLNLNVDYVLNIQGDEPLVLSSDLERLILQAHNTEGTRGATLIYKITKKAMLDDPNVVKVTLNNKKQALYFSRSLIPFISSGQTEKISIWRHLGHCVFRWTG